MNKFNLGDKVITEDGDLGVVVEVIEKPELKTRYKIQTEFYGAYFFENEIMRGD